MNNITSMIVIINNTGRSYYIDNEYPPLFESFSIERRLIIRLKKKFDNIIQLHHTNSFSDLHRILEATKESANRILISNFSPNWDFPYLDEMHESRGKDEYFENNIGDYCDTKNIFRFLFTKYPNLKTYIVTGASKSIITDSEITSLGSFNQIRVKRRREFKGGLKDFDRAYGNYIEGIILKELKLSKTSLINASKLSALENYSPPRYWYQPGEMITIEGVLPEFPGSIEFIMLDSPDPKLDPFEDKYFRKDYLPHPTFEPFPAILPKEYCLYCGNKLFRLLNTYWISENRSNNASSAFCIVCGWWVFRGEERFHFNDNNEIAIGHRILQLGELMKFNLEDIHLPISVAAEAINSDPKSTSYINPRRFEEIIAYTMSAYYSCKVELTKTTKDGGYDILAIYSDKGQFLVEVKRKSLRSKRNKIGVDVVRKLCGAMVYHNVPNGMIVTNTTFSPEAKQAVREISSHGWTIDLHDIDDICDWLGVFRPGRSSTVGVDQDDLERKVLSFQSQLGQKLFRYQPLLYVKPIDQEVFEI